MGEFEELFEHSVRSVEHVLGEIVTRVDEAGLQAAADPVDHGSALHGAALLERQQVDFQDLAHVLHGSDFQGLSKSRSGFGQKSGS